MRAALYGLRPERQSDYVSFGDALVVWSIPANKNIAKFILGFPGNVWELSRLWAPDGHVKNLLTQAISAATKVIIGLENPDALSVATRTLTSGIAAGFTAPRVGSDHW